MGDLTKKQASGVVKITDENESDCVTIVTDGSAERLQVETGMDAQGSAGAPGCPVFSNNAFIEFNSTGAMINSTTFTTLESYTGSGKLISFALVFDTNQINLKLTVDSNVIFEVDDMKDYIATLNSSSHSGVNHPYGWENNSKLFSFAPYCPIEFATDWEIEAMSTAGSNKNYSSGTVFYTKET